MHENDNKETVHTNFVIMFLRVVRNVCVNLTYLCILHVDTTNLSILRKTVWGAIIPYNQDILIIQAEHVPSHSPNRYKGLL